MAKQNTKTRAGLSQETFKQRLEKLIGKKPMKLWLAKSAMGRLDVIFSVGDAQGQPVKNFDHIGGFYLLGEKNTEEYMEDIHRWFIEFCRTNYTPYRLERHFIDVSSRTYFDNGKRYRDEFMMHVPLAVHPPGGKG